eukprot:COSAG03_NODE_251_length_9941_cov_18.085145_13_plen_194_part_00
MPSMPARAAAAAATVDIDAAVKQKLLTTYDQCFNLGAPPVVATKEMAAKDPREKGAGEIARDALCEINPVVRSVLSLALGETIKTASKRKKFQEALGLIEKPTKKRKSGTGKEKPVDEVPYYVLYYFAQDVLVHGQFAAEKLRKILRRVCRVYCEETNQTLKSAERESRPICVVVGIHGWVVYQVQHDPLLAC